MCENSFTCYSEVYFAGVFYEGIGWFFSMLVAAFWLQILANFLWLKNTQLSREILQAPLNSSKRKALIGWSVFWTGISTLVWILRIVLIIGNNVWIFITILLGNVTGTFWASSVQVKDVSTFLTLLDSREGDKILSILKERLDNLNIKKKKTLVL